MNLQDFCDLNTFVQTMELDTIAELINVNQSHGNDDVGNNSSRPKLTIPQLICEAITTLSSVVSDDAVAALTPEDICASVEVSHPYFASASASLKKSVIQHLNDRPDYFTPLESGEWGLVDGAERVIFPAAAIAATVDDHQMDDENSDPAATIKEEEDFDGGNIDEPPYSCDRCHFSAKRRATLVKHVKENHEDDENTAAKSNFIHKCEKCAFR